ncbi:hypothetical protein AB0I84_00660 [Streptomyces spectabilis]|uniref:hypothetical protein n=1 Tax=Streptomyces spectabilis TaxID=68270 RepID=UPI0033F8937F
MTETATTKTAAKRPARKTDLLTQILAEVKATRLKIDRSDLPFRGGEVPEHGRAYFELRGTDWGFIHADRERTSRDGFDSHLVSRMFKALAIDFEDEEAEDSRAYAQHLLIEIAAYAVAAIEYLERGGQ